MNFSLLEFGRIRQWAKSLDILCKDQENSVVRTLTFHEKFHTIPNFISYKSKKLIVIRSMSILKNLKFNFVKFTFNSAQEPRMKGNRVLLVGREIRKHISVYTPASLLTPL